MNQSSEDHQKPWGTVRHLPTAVYIGILALQLFLLVLLSVAGYRWTLAAYATMVVLNIYSLYRWRNMEKSYEAAWQQHQDLSAQVAEERARAVAVVMTRTNCSADEAREVVDRFMQTTRDQIDIAMADDDIAIIEQWANAGVRQPTALERMWGKYVKRQSIQG